MRTPLTPNPKHYYFDNKNFNPISPLSIPFSTLPFPSSNLPFPPLHQIQLNSTLLRKLSFEVRLCTESKWNINSNIKIIKGSLEIKE